MLAGIFSSKGLGRVMARTIVALGRRQSRLQRKSISIDEFEIVYLEGGQGPTILFIHGFGGDKEHWTQFARSFTRRYHVIAIDLPGFGESTRHPKYSYSPKAQAQRLEKFRNALGLNTMHLVGSSMGGMIATAFAQAFPSCTLSLTLIDSGGIRSPRPSEFTEELRAGRNPLVVKSRDDMVRLIRFNFFKPPYIPGFMITQLHLKNSPHSELSHRIFAELIDNEGLLEELLPDVHAPLLVIWGERDRVLDVSATQIIQKIKPTADVKILRDCGHTPMLERGRETATILLQFLEERAAGVSQQSDQKKSRAL